MTPGLLAGLDVGTSACKAVVTDLEGGAQGHGHRATPWTPVASGAEIDPAALLDTAIGALDDARRAAPAGVVLGVGVTSMAETGFLLDGAGTPMHPGIAWDDRRGEDEAAALARDLGDRFPEHTGLRATSRPGAVKYRWLLHHRPEIRRARRWLNVAEWIVHGLGGEQVAEPSLATRTGWLDCERGRWWDETLAWSGADEALLPPLRQAGTAAGHVRGVPGVDGAVLTVAGHDHLCAAIGAGATGDGDVLNSCGTAEVHLRAVPLPVPPEDRTRIAGLGLSRGRHVVPDRMAVLGGVPTGRVLGRLLTALEVDGPGAADALGAPIAAPTTSLSLDEVEHLAAGLTAAPPAPEAGRLWRLGVEAAVAASADLLARLESATGPADRIVAVGGWARSGLLAARKRTCLGRVETPDVPEAGARGAALLAGVAAGRYASALDVPPPDPTPAPRPA